MSANKDGNLIFDQPIDWRTNIEPQSSCHTKIAVGTTSVPWKLKRGLFEWGCLWCWEDGKRNRPFHSFPIVAPYVSKKLWIIIMDFWWFCYVLLTKIRLKWLYSPPKTAAALALECDAVDASGPSLGIRTAEIWGSQLGRFVWTPYLQ